MTNITAAAAVTAAKSIIDTYWISFICAFILTLITVMGLVRQNRRRPQTVGSIRVFCCSSNDDSNKKRLLQEEVDLYWYDAFVFWVGVGTIVATVLGFALTVANFVPQQQMHEQGSAVEQQMFLQFRYLLVCAAEAYGCIGIAGFMAILESYRKVPMNSFRMCLVLDMVLMSYLATPVATMNSFFTFGIFHMHVVSVVINAIFMRHPQHDDAAALIGLAAAIADVVCPNFRGIHIAVGGMSSAQGAMVSYAVDLILMMISVAVVVFAIFADNSDEGSKKSNAIAKPMETIFEKSLKEPLLHVNDAAIYEDKEIA